MVKFTHPDGCFFDERNFSPHQLESLLGPQSGLNLMANTGTVLVEESAL
jgi:hypothetical protein